MTEIYEGSFVYVTVDEKDLVGRLFRLKDAAAIYYRGGKKIAYHWLLNSITIKKLGIKDEHPK